MKRKVLTIVIMIAVVMSLAVTVLAISAAAPASANEAPVATISEAYIPSETSEPELTEPEEEVIILEIVEVERVEPTTLDEANSALESATFRNDTAVAVYEGLVALGYDQGHPATVLAETEKTNAEVDLKYYTEIQAEFQEEYEWELRAAEYPTATQSWLYMKSLGWSDYICAGIMGNMMAECGGQTLNLKWSVYSSTGFYGLCQWHPTYYSSLQGASLERQLKFLGESTKDTFDGWAGQAFGYTYEEFLALDSCEEAARVFCIVYERPGGYDYQRSRNALAAYEYFVG